MAKLSTIKIYVFFAGIAVLTWSTGTASEPPEGIQGNVTVINDEAHPVPVTVQNAEQEDPLEVVGTLPLFYRVERTVFGNSVADRQKKVPVDARVIIYDITAQTSSIHLWAGCRVSVFVLASDGSGPLTALFSTAHFDKDLGAFADGQTTQQRLGRGVVIEPGNDINIHSAGITNPDIGLPPDGSGFCSSQVSVYGEVLPD